MQNTRHATNNNGQKIKPRHSISLKDSLKIIKLSMDIATHFQRGFHRYAAALLDENSPAKLTKPNKFIIIKRYFSRG
jgi:hypothetical protein